MSYFALSMMTLAFSLNVVDRLLPAILAAPMQKDLNLSDTQLGLLNGLLFSAFYALVGVPLGWAADRYNRTKLVALSCGFWSLCCGASGFVTSFAGLAMTRIGVAIGEAGCSPAAYSILSDYFDRHQRARAIAIYTLGIPVGTLAAAAGGGWLTQNHGWRSAFLVAAVLGLIVSASLFVVVREPARGQRDGEAQRAGASVKTIFGKLLASPFHRRTMAAITLMSCVSSGVTVWIPSFLLREKGMQMQDIMHYYGLGSAIAIGAGMLWSGWLADRLRARRPAGQLLVPSAMMAIGVVPLTAAIIVPGWQAALVLFSICLFCFGCYLSPSVSAIQERVPAAERSTAISIYIVIYSLLGSATGPLIVGGLSDLFAQQAKGSSLAAGLFVMAMLSVATSIMYWAAANSERPSPVRS